jgi:hypothetical protein
MTWIAEKLENGTENKVLYDVQVTRLQVQNKRELNSLTEITKPTFQLHPKGRPSSVQQKCEFRFEKVFPPRQRDRDSIENDFIPMHPNCPTVH